MIIFHVIWSKLKLFLQEWHASPPISRFNRFYSIGTFCGNLMGIRMLSDCRIVWYSGSVGLCLVLYYTLAIYTLVHCALQGHFADGLPCLSVSVIYLSVCTN